MLVTRIESAACIVVYNIIYITYFYCYDYLCDELITRPEESYRLWCVVVCDLGTSRIGAPYIHMTLVA
jgi:hypothetical protein